MNNKGFMMAEVVVVASIVLVTLVGFYTSYNKIISIYNKRVDYYDVATLYKLADVRDRIVLTGKSSMSIILNDDLEKVYYLKKSDLNNLNVSNQTFKDYIDFLDGSVTFDTDYILIMERCIDEDNCKYAYLEVD